eukprot:TRINITY_DN29053_c0_g1_i1.p1 TRINITY_DN29053_c0_g1~~TRINITY_DN29053_c0_g1_i1.p1  ORF type:complete len:158 (-),score=29.29 TRINITY_DN29053_c0_g1_i1:43-468(-)
MEGKEDGVVALGVATQVHGATQIHALPCKIHADGPALVSRYFLPEAHTDGQPGEMEADFRGRRLLGKPTELPEGTCGVVLRESTCPQHIKSQLEDEQVSAYWSIESSFSNVTVWGHDEIQRDHAVQRAVEWMSLANAVHDP